MIWGTAYIRLMELLRLDEL